MTRRILILAMSYPPQAVGTGTYAHRLACGLAASGCSVRVVAPAALGDAAFDEASGCSVARCALPAAVPLRYLKARRLLLEQIQDFDPDCVWATNGMGTRVAGLLRVWRDTPLITSMRGSDVTVRLGGTSLVARLEAALQRRAYADSVAIAAVSHFVRARAAAQGVDADTVFVHPPAWDARVLDGYRYDQAAFGGRFPDLAGKRIVLTVARLVRQKRVDRALRASGRLLKEFPDMVHVVVGDGPERNQLERMAGELGWGDRVLFTGAVPPMSPELFDLYSAASAFVLPSVGEGMGNVFIEAGAFALPCLGVADGGVSECIEDGRTGLLARPDDVEDLSAKLRYLLKDAARARQMGEAARDRMGREFSVDRLVRGALETIERVVDHG